MSFLDVFLLLLIWIPLIMLWVFTLTDLAGRADLSAAAKGLWAVGVVLLPLIGMIIYFIAKPGDAEMESDPDARFQQIRSDAGLDAPTLDQLEKLGDLRDKGAITQDEFAAMKAKVLG